MESSGLHGVAASEDAGRVEQFDIIAELGSEGGEFGEYGVFVLGVGQVQRAGLS